LEASVKGRYRGARTRPWGVVITTRTIIRETGNKESARGGRKWDLLPEYCRQQVGGGVCRGEKREKSYLDAAKKRAALKGTEKDPESTTVDRPVSFPQK